MKKLASGSVIPASFRDPSGFLFHRDGVLYRQVNQSYRDNYDSLINSGLYEILVKEGLLISHEEVDIETPQPEIVYKVIKPELVPFVSYPYEWCFSQIKDAALITLKVQKKALEFGMSLKDSSAYNIQFVNGKPIFIDTLSFEKYVVGRPWVAYRQFCQHFLAPLALMSYKDVRLNQLLRIYLDGIPLDMASSLLPFRTRLNFSLLSHLHLHARSQRYFADKTVKVDRYKLSRMALLGILDSLESSVTRMKWQPVGTEWADYYEATNYSPVALEHKREIVAEFLDRIKPRSVWDLGANIGVFSRLASNRGTPTISFDLDPVAVEKNYLTCVKEGETLILPLVLDLANPSPGIGWGNRERMSLEERGPSDAALALAFLHHLAISNNLPFTRIAEFLQKICNSLIIEFAPKGDSQVQRLLSTREDIFPDYNQDAFEAEFSKYFTLQKHVNIKDSERSVYLMVAKGRQT